MGHSLHHRCTHSQPLRFNYVSQPTLSCFVSRFMTFLSTRIVFFFVEEILSWWIQIYKVFSFVYAFSAYQHFLRACLFYYTVWEVYFLMDYGFVFFLHDWNQGYFSNYKFFCFLVSSSEGHVVASSNADCINRYDQLHKSYLLVSFGDFELFCHFECSSYAKGKFCCNSILKCEGKKRRGSGYDNGGEEKEKNCLLTYA